MSYVIGRYFDTFIPLAINISRELKAQGGEERIRWMCHSWIVSMYLDCPPDAGLHCPDAAALGEFDEAVRDGTITWHAFPHNAELSVINAATFKAGVELTHALDARFNLPPKTVLSQRDVPGFPRGAIAAAVAANVTAFSEGMNGRIVPPLLAPGFRWRDASRNAEILVWWHAFGYGHDPNGFSLNEDRRQLAEAGSKCDVHPTSGELRRLQQHDGPFPQPSYMPSNCGPEYLVLPGLDEALVYDWRGDNAGPPLSTAEVQKTWDIVRGWFPEASTSAGGRGIVASDLDSFTMAVKAAESTLAALPVVEKEIVRSSLGQNLPLFFDCRRGAECRAILGSWACPVIPSRSSGCVRSSERAQHVLPAQSVRTGAVMAALLCATFRASSSRILSVRPFAACCLHCEQIFIFLCG